MTRKLFLSTILLASSITLSGCLFDENGSSADSNISESVSTNEEQSEFDNLLLETQSQPDEQIIYLAGGCFWGVEAYFDRIPGVLDTESGYANGSSDQTSYEDLADTGHAETIKLTYDANRLHLAEILDRYYLIIDPFSVNKQGNDIGVQYRTGIYYSDESAGEIAVLSLSLLEERLGRETRIDLEPLEHFIRAEEYHQDYLEKNPNGYCHVDLDTSELDLYPGDEKPDDESLKENLPGLVYDVTQKKGTEQPFSSEYDDFYETGIYVDVITGQPLFSSVDKYDAECGWPSFTQPITTDVMNFNLDLGLGMERIEVEARDGDNHLGHVFSDGPEDDGGLRYCINGASLRFIAENEMREEGYASLLPYLLG